MLFWRCPAKFPKLSRLFGYAGPPQRASAADVNTNVAKDVLLFKNDRPKFFRLMNVFAICQYTFWTYLGYAVQTNLKDIPVEAPPPDAPWYRRYNLGTPGFRRSLVAITVVAGTACLGVCWMYTLRSVRYLVLHKGGKTCSFVTYTPVGRDAVLRVALADVSSETSRAANKVQMAVKIRNKYLYYVLDMQGEFKNPTLFDHTVGLRRKF